MLKPDLIPTPLTDPGSVPPVSIAARAELKRASSLWLVFQLIGFGFSMMWASRVRHRPALELALKARAFLEELGGLWIKAGQLVSLRIDLLSPEMADQLSELQYQSFGFDPHIARQIVETNLRQPIEQVFSAFEDHPFAAASISQLHRARLRSEGHWVAVKVQRPGMEKVMNRDLGLITWILRRMNHVPSVSYITWDGMIRELEHMLHEEIDYRYEAANMRRMRKLLRRHKVYVPKVYRHLCTRQVIVMEYLPGVVMSEYLRVLRTNPARLHQWELENNIVPDKVGRRLMLSFYRQLYEEPIFHGDLHPGNIMLLRDSRIALIDFGTVGSLEKKFVELYGQMARAIAQGDFAKSSDLYLMLADSVPLLDINAYRAESVDITRAWEARTHMDGLTFLERSITGGLGLDLADLNRRYRVNPSWQFLRVSRSVATMDSNLSVLLKNENPTRILRQFFRQSRRRAVRRIRKDAVKTVTNAVADSLEVAGYFSETLRRQAIQIRGAQSKVSQIFGVMTNLARLAIFAVGAFLIYDFLHTHHFNIVDEIHDDLGAFGELAEQVPTADYEIGIVILIAVVLIFFVAGRIRRILARQPVRMPDGHMER